ncbi:MAG: hypothetical protein J5554_03295 [Paludibacteraceae bacterium]|nr:hypothetical protein [Paludibacteraceae bacterium]
MRKLKLLGSVLLLFVFMFFVGSCSKSDDEKETEYSVNVQITNHRAEEVYFYIDATFKSKVKGETVHTEILTMTNYESSKFSVRTITGEILESKTIREGDSFVVEINPEVSNPDGNSSNEETSTKWNLPIKVFNASSEPLYVYINGKLELTVNNSAVEKNFTVKNQNKAVVDLKDRNSNLLFSKTIGEGGSYNVASLYVGIINLWSNSDVQLYMNGDKVESVKGGDVLSKYYFISGTCSVQIKDVAGNILDSKKIDSSEAAVYSYDSRNKEKAYVVIQNQKSDNYYIYLDEELVFTLAPNREGWIAVDPGTHTLKAVQKDGYMLWASEFESKANFDKTMNYTWNFKEESLTSYKYDF